MNTKNLQWEFEKFDEDGDQRINTKELLNWMICKLCSGGTSSNIDLKDTSAEKAYLNVAEAIILRCACQKNEKRRKKLEFSSQNLSTGLAKS